MAWSDRFDDPVPLPAGGALVSLEDAARYIQKLPKKEQKLAHWQTATSILIAAAEGRDFVLHARIAMLRAIHHGQPAPEPTRTGKAAKTYRIIR